MGTLREIIAIILMFVVIMVGILIFTVFFNKLSNIEKTKETNFKASLNHQEKNFDNYKEVT